MVPSYRHDLPGTYAPVGATAAGLALSCLPSVPPQGVPMCLSARKQVMFITASLPPYANPRTQGVPHMTNDGRNVLDVLRAELEFLENAGYHHSARAAWRPQFMFQDSPTCLNSDRAQLAKPCSDCVLMQLIPEDLRDRNIPCRYIPLNESGETVESFYLTGTQEEQETAVAHWLKITITGLERDASRRQSCSGSSS